MAAKKLTEIDEPPAAISLRQNTDSLIATREGCEQMTKNTIIEKKATLQLIAILILLVQSTGCITFTNYAIPADRLPECLRAPEKGKRVPLNLALLGQKAPREYTISPGDVLGLYVRGLIPASADEAPPLIQTQNNFTNIYYPAIGQNSTPAVGFPMEVNPSGQLVLPVIGGIQVTGLTVEQTAKLIANACIEKKIVQAGREYVYITLIRSNVTRVLVIRDEAPSDVPQFLRKDAPLLTKRGHAQIVDLPNFENDVLHALSASGGLPGVDAHNEVWILRRDTISPEVRQQMWDSSGSPEGMTSNLIENQCYASATRIPLWLNPCDSVNFTQNDVLLHEGDVVFVRARSEEYFYTAGLLEGGVVPMPRDQDLDILEAIALANGSVGGAGGASGIAVIRTGSGPGNIIPPSRATIVRKLPNEQQVTIRVDLSKAVRDPKHRVLVQPQDIVSLHYKPGEVTSNALLNIINFNFVFPN